MIRIDTQVPLAPYTTLKVGGPAEFFVIVQNVGELKEAVSHAHAHGLPVTTLGGGSNILVSNDGVRGLVIKNEIGGVAYDDEHHVVTAGAGVVLDDLVADTVARGWWGLENLSAIPGTVGATPVQNVGAYGVEVSDRIAHVEVFDPATMSTRIFTPPECGFSYRHSIFKESAGTSYIVTRVAFACSSTPMPVLTYKDLAEHFKDIRSPDIGDVRQAVVAIRAKKFPDWKVVGTAGSFFKNPVVSHAAGESLRERFPDMPSYPAPDGVKIPLGWILEHVCHMRGYRHGDVGTFEGQALVIVNYGTHDASVIKSFARALQSCVKENTHIDTEWEVTEIN